MSDENLLIFGCAVTFVALAGVYVYLRESFTRGREPSDRQAGESVPVEIGVEVRS